MRTGLRQQTTLLFADTRVVRLRLEKKGGLLDDVLEEGLHGGRTLPNALQEASEERHALPLFVNGLTEGDAVCEKGREEKLGRQALEKGVRGLLADGEKGSERVGVGEVVEGGERGDECGVGSGEGGVGEIEWLMGEQ